MVPFTEILLKSDDVLVKICTGLPNYKDLTVISDFVAPSQPVQIKYNSRSS